MFEDRSIQNPKSKAQNWTSHSGELPLVSVVIPCRNEERTIRDCVLSLCTQQYPLEQLEILVADGRSTDRTREILHDLMKEIPQLRLVDNPQIISPAAMNRAIRASHGSVIVLLGAHATLSVDYIMTAVQLLDSTAVDCVGGRLETVTTTPSAQAIALAMSSPFGVGDAKFRYSDQEEFVDTVAFGVYRRIVFDQVGYFDEQLPRNEDDEFNYRLRKAGGKILLSPRITAKYYARSSLRALWRQYFGYGRGKVKVAQKHATMMRLRHLIPALFVTALVLLPILSLFQPLALILFAFVLGAYSIATSYFSLAAGRRYGWRHIHRLPVAFFILHLSYGCGTIIGAFSLLVAKLQNEDASS
jgi:cellulose synthase/poly-beta-1,6-N-acetylglucosamine synthase-like glycosyltransferase